MNKNNLVTDRIEAMAALQTERDKLREIHYMLERMRQQTNLIENFGKVISYLEHQSEIFRQSIKKRMNDSVIIIPNESTDVLPDVDFLIVDKWRLLFEIAKLLEATEIISFETKTINAKLNEASRKI